jgi:hypothetical protein
MAAILDIGPYFFSKTKITFKELWGFVIIAEFVFLLVPIFKIIWFYFCQTNYTLYFYPLLALNIVDEKELEP